MMKIKKFKIQGDPMKIAIEWQNTIKTSFNPPWLAAVDVKALGKGEKLQPYLLFAFDKSTFAKRVLSAVFRQGVKNYGSTSDFAGQRILVEFSSPNIAKPFHVGHLRSTIIGNFLQNLYKKLGAETISINYLGDWGTQYGLLALGFEKFGDEQELLANPIQHLFNVYVAANKQVRSENNDSFDNTGVEYSEFAARSRAHFKKLEDGDEQALEMWQRFRDLSIVEYKKSYERLNVNFDVYSGESQMQDGIIGVIDKLKEKGLLSSDENGAQIVDLTAHNAGIVMIKKPDGATLYLTRDLAAAKDRMDKYQFDKCIYVVASQQDLHFRQMFKILELMGYDWAKPEQGRLCHINFGMVMGMSTRDGNVVFLDDILNEAKSTMLEKMKHNENNKLKEIVDLEKTADIIGLSAVVIQDMAAHRIKDYQFSLDRMTSAEGSTGPFLQYTHARLCCMEDLTPDIQVTDQVDFEHLLDKPSIELTAAISRYPMILQSCAKNHEPSILVNYLFDLCRAISIAYTQLYVMGSPEPVAQARKLLFWCGRAVLNSGLTLIGLTPLTRI